MGLRFVFGAAGSGKTRYLYDQVISRSLEHPEHMHLVMVPEQFTMQAQRELVRLHPSHGLMNIDVLSFKRLAYRVFDELGVQVPVVLDDMGKSMVLRRVLGKQGKELRLYGSHLGQTGFINQLKSQLSELYQYGIRPENLKELAAQAQEPLLAQKLQDLEWVYQAFQAYIKDHYITAEEILDILCRELPRSERIRKSVVYLDGYTGFTPVQYRLVQILIRQALDVVCTVTVDQKTDPYQESGIQNLFYMSKHTVARLEGLAGPRDRSQDVVLSQRPGRRYQNSPALDFLEQNLYRYRGRTWDQKQNQVLLLAGQTPAEEVRYAAASIEALVRGRGLRYRDMAIVTGDLASYGREIQRQFSQAGIPFFMDNKKSILENPMVELIRAALELILDFSYDSVFRYLKCGLVYDREPGEDSEVSYNRQEAQVLTARLENYVRALGIRGWKQWNQTWERRYRGGENLNLEELNQFRQWVLAPLTPLRQAITQPEATIQDVTQALRTFLEGLQIRQKLEDCRDLFAQRGEYKDESLVQEYSQVYDLAEEMFQRLEGLLGEEKAERRVYAQILDAGFGEIQVGMIPATLDQVVAGDITRSRLEGVKVLFFLGVNDGVVPQRKAGGSLLTDRDREFFKAHHLELAPTAREESCMQKFYLYLMLSKPSDRLVLTWACRSQDGKAMTPSGLLGEVRKLFPGIPVLQGADLKWPVQTLGDGKELLIQGLRSWAGAQDEPEQNRDPETLKLYRWFLDHPQYEKKARALADGAFYSYQERGIGQAAAQALYGRTLQGSVTRLEQYASCAYAHFLRYGLELMERQEFELEAVDIGNLFHQSIDRCFRIMKDRGGDWRTLTEQDRKELVRESVTQTVENYGNTIMASSARYAYLAGRVQRMTDRTIWALGEQVKKGDFEPAGFEVSFSASDQLKAMKIPLSAQEELRLKGRIDRIDLCQDGDMLYVKIIDYKSGSTSFDLTSLFYGLQLQLVVYMDAALEMEERRHPALQVVPAGIFYYNIQDPLVDQKEKMDPEEISRQILKQLRMNGLVNQELEVIRHLDREIQTQSDVIPVALKAGLVQESRSSVASTRRFGQLRRFVHGKLRRAGQEILEGEASLKPCRQGSRTACDYCPYHAVCGFDVKTAGFGYRRLKALKPEEIWAQLEEEANEE